MEIYEAIEKRRTFRKFKAPPTDDQLERVLDAGALAPSAGNNQAWFVVIVNDPETKETMGEIKKKLNATFTPDTEKGRAMLGQFWKVPHCGCQVITSPTIFIVVSRSWIDEAIIAGRVGKHMKNFTLEL